MIRSLHEQVVQRCDALFIAWQDQATKKYFPVGRLIRAHDEDGSSTYEFCYVKGLSGAQGAGFTHIVSFPDPDAVYRSTELFPLFSNRLMPRSRPDFAEYVQRLELDPRKADEFEILARSGGRRVTDSLELFPVPDLHRDGCYVTYFLAHGIRYLDEGTHNRIGRLEKNEQLFVVADFQNPADSTALALRTRDRVIVGYLPRYLLQDAWTLQVECGYIKVFAQQINQSPAPIQHRLLCRMESCWPDGFIPYSTEDYDPVPADATRLQCSDET